MKSGALAIVGLLCLASAASAEPIEIRSGEHEDFSRLVLPVSQRLSWRSEETADGVTVLFGNEDLDIDTSKVFERIPRDRLSAIRWLQDQNALRMTFACDCSLRSFWHGPGMLVFDIRDTPADSSVAAEDIRTTPAPAARPDPAAAPGSFAGALTSARMLPLQPPGRGRAEDEREIVPGYLDRMHSRLLTQLSRAARQGLLSVPDTPETAGEPVGREDATRTSPLDPTETAENRSPARTNLSAESSMDRDLPRGTLHDMEKPEAVDCLPEELVDIPAWGTDKPFADQVGPLNRTLIGEFDKPDPDTARRLARLYIHFGFGAEALQTLSMASDTLDDTDVMQDLARIAENGHAPPGSNLNGQMHCDSPAAFWSALSYRDLPDGIAIDGDAVLRAFNALPGHLRAYYGPDLSRRFLRAGHHETAQNLLRIVERNISSVTPDAGLARAEISGGDETDIDTGLERVIESNSAASAEALLALIDRRLRSDRPISREIAQLAGAFAHEYRDAPLGTDLAKAHARALAGSGAFDKAYAEFDRTKERLDSQAQLELRSDLLVLLESRGDDPAFLRHVLGGRGKPLADLPPAVGNAVARRLLELGFHEDAARYAGVSIPENGAETRARKLLRARISLALGQAHEAEIELIGLTGRDAKALRGRARATRGDHGAAFEYFTEAERDHAARRSAWLAEDWANLLNDEDETLGDLARIMLGERDPARKGEGTGVLARNRGLLDESHTARSTLRDLLAANPMPEGTPE